MLVDTHCHLEMLGDGQEVEEIILRAREASLIFMVTIGTDFASSEKSCELTRQYNDVFATVGVHPHEVKTIGSDIFDKFRDLIERHPKIRGIGETGLDFYYDHSPRETQKSAFVNHIRLAKERALPLVIHSRNAPKETIDILKKEKAEKVGGIIHCFTENLEMALAAIELNFLISFSGIITFNNSSSLREVVSQIPLDKILIETDSPFLSPVPFRGKKNEPMRVKHVAEKIAEIKKVPVEKIMSQTTENAKRIYGLSSFSGESSGTT